MSSISISISEHGPRHRRADLGGLAMVHWLEGASLLETGLARHGVGRYGFALGDIR